MSLLNSIISPLLALYIFQASLSCTGNKNEIKGISVVYRMPIVNYDSSIVNNESRIEKYFFRDLVMYRYNYNQNNFEDNKLLSSEKRFYYFVFHKDSVKGMLFSPHQVFAMPEGYYQVDSVVKKNRIYNDRVDILASRTPDSVVSLPNGDKIRYYTPLPDSLQPEPYKLSFYYTKNLPGINESISDKMDNEPGMKLYRISIQSEGWYYEKFKMKFPAREYLMEIKKLEPEESQNPEVLKYLEQYISSQQH